MEIIKDYSASLKDKDVFDNLINTIYRSRKKEIIKINGNSAYVYILDRDLIVHEGKNFENTLETTSNEYIISLFSPIEENWFFCKETIFIVLFSNQADKRKEIASSLKKFFRKNIRYPIGQNDSLLHYYDKKNSGEDFTKYIANIKPVYGKYPREEDNNSPEVVENTEDENFIYLFTINYFFDPKKYKRFLNNLDEKLEKVNNNIAERTSGIKNLNPSIRMSIEETANKIVSDLKNIINQKEH